MRPPGPLLASGRDADVFEYGPGLVLRRTHDGRSLVDEARIQGYLHAQGYPVPEVVEVSEDGRDLVMARVDGPTMVDAVAARPWTVRRSSRELAALHERLHALVAPSFLPPAPVGAGDAILHLDLHPLNVLLSPTGPVVIDWTNASRGDPASDVTLAWALMAAGRVEGGRLRAATVAVARRVALAAFLEGKDRAALAAPLREVVTWKVTDAHLSSQEVAAMWALVRRVESRR